MKRREFIALLGGVAAATWPLAARAQQPERRIGVLMGLVESDPEAQSLISTTRQRLGELGWSEGRNIRIDDRWAAGDADRLRAYAAELVSLKPDVIFGEGTPVVAALQQATRTIPIVFVNANNPIGFGFVASMARPGGNITGFVNVEGSIGGKWLELLKEVVPRTRRAVLIFNPATATYFDYYWKPLQVAARAAGVSPLLLPVGNLAEIEQAFATRDRDDGIVAMSDPFLTVNRTLINEKALQFRVPVVSGASGSGSLISYAPDTEDIFRRTATYVDKILHGALPADLPVQLPIKFELSINLKTAKALDLTIPPALLTVADEVIE
jgi:putative tryptophan/tyrosine transport system substrate-binding protein